MAGCGDGFFIYNLVRAAGVQEEHKSGYYVSTSILISKSVKKEEWGLFMWSSGGVLTESVNVECWRIRDDMEALLDWLTIVQPP